MFTPQVNALIPYFLYGMLIIGFFCAIAFFRGVRIVNTYRDRYAQSNPPGEVKSPTNGEMPMKGTP